MLDAAIGSGCPLTLAIAGPVTVSGQHQTWLIPLLETGWIAYLSTTDAVCYHDGHRSLDAYTRGPDSRSADLRRRRRAARRGHHPRHRHGVRRGRAARSGPLPRPPCLPAPEFQRKMTGTELRYLLGQSTPRRKRRTASPTGLLAVCHRLAIPIFVGAPGDGSVFLNSMKLWAMQRAGLHAGAYASSSTCTARSSSPAPTTRWGLFEQRGQGARHADPRRRRAQELQPAARAGARPGARACRTCAGYLFDVQIVTAPVTDGSLSSCPPAEAVTWGKVDKDDLPADHREHAGGLLDGHAVPGQGAARQAARATQRCATSSARRSCCAGTPKAKPATCAIAWATGSTSSANDLVAEPVAERRARTRLGSTRR